MPTPKKLKVLSYNDVDWDIDAKASEFHRNGRRLAFAFWAPYKDSINFSDVRGFHSYPVCSDLESWVEQVQYLTREVMPVVDAYSKWRLSPFYSENQKQHDATLRQNIRSVWAARPKKRRGQSGEAATEESLL